MGVGIVSADTRVHISQISLTSEECIYIGYFPLLMATNSSELTALYMETTKIVNCWKVVKKILWNDQRT